MPERGTVDELELRRRGRPDSGLDDIGNAARFVDEHGDALRYVPAWKRWLRYDGCRWVEDDLLEHQRRAKETARNLAKEAANERDERRQQDLLGHAKRSASESRVRAIYELARSDERIAIRPCDLDADPWILNTETGVVDLRTGDLLAHAPGQHLMRIAGASYDPEAPAPLWEAHLRRCVVDSELIAFLQRLAGISAIGVTREHLLIILFGSGANGKSVFRNAIASALGDYAYQSTVDLILHGGSRGQATPELAELRGRRFVTIGETPADGRLASERVKWITGGEPITARHLYGNPFTFEPSHTVWLGTNDKPTVDDEGDGIWRRIKLVEFGVTIPGPEQDPKLGEKLAGELPGILRWIIDGARGYLSEGLSQPDSVSEATDTYRDDEDTFGRFLDDRRIVVDDTASAPATQLLKIYEEWAVDAGAPTLTRNKLSAKLQARGFVRHRDSKGVRWLGIGLRNDTRPGR